MDLVLPPDSSSNDTSGVDRVIKRDFEYVAELQRSMAMRERVNRKPKRSLTAYNLFFKSERAKLVKAKRKLGFSDMAKEISAKWNALDFNDRKQFEEEAVNEKRRYKLALSQWKAQSKLDLMKLIANQQQHITTSGDCMLTQLPSLVSQNKPDPSLIRRHSVQQQVVEQQMVMQAQLQNAALFAGPRRMPMTAFTSSLAGGSEESDSSASLPMSPHGEMTTFYHGLSWSSIPPLGTRPRRMSMPTFISSPLVEASEESHKNASLPMSFHGSTGRRGEVTTRQHELLLSSVPPLPAGPRRMSVPAFTSSPPVEGSEESEKGAFLPKSLQVGTGCRFSLQEMAGHGQSLSSVPLLASFGADSSDPADCLKPYASGCSGGNDAWMDGENLATFMSMLYRDAKTTEDDSIESCISMVSGMGNPTEPFSVMNATKEASDQTYGSMISCMLEPSPMRRSSMPCIPIGNESFGEVNNSPSFSMPISRVAEMKELREIIQFLDWEVAKEDASNFHDDAE